MPTLEPVVDPSALTVSQFQVTGLDTALAGKSNVGHTHNAGEISGLGSAATKNADNSANNIPILDGSGKLSTGVLPALAINDTFVVASQAAMLALTAQRGDVAIRTDQNKSYMLAADDATILANWQHIITAGDAPVQSVAGRTGAVTIASADITDATSNRTQNVIVKRDSQGGFLANFIELHPTGTQNGVHIVGPLSPSAENYDLFNIEVGFGSPVFAVNGAGNTIIQGIDDGSGATLQVTGNAHFNGNIGINMQADPAYDLVAASSISAAGFYGSTIVGNTINASSMYASSFISPSINATDIYVTTLTGDGFGLSNSGLSCSRITIDPENVNDTRAYRVIAARLGASTNWIPLYDIQSSGQNHGWVEATISLYDTGADAVVVQRCLWMIRDTGSPAIAVVENAIGDPFGENARLNLISMGGYAYRIQVEQAGGNVNFLNISYTIRYKFDYPGAGPTGYY